MKKGILLSVAAFMAAMSVSAQVEKAAFTTAQAEAVGLVSGSKVEIAGGTKLLESDNVTVTLLYTQPECGMTGLSKNNVSINGEELGSETGIQGNVNGPGSALEGTFPESGCIYHFDVKKDGYVYVFHKGTNSKGYVVYEEKVARPSFVFAMSDFSIVRGFDLSTIEGATFNDPEGGVYVNDGYKILTPGETTVKDADGNKVPVPGYVADMPSGTSVIKFQVFEGLGYDVLATGSKMTFAGYAFDENGDANIDLNVKNEDTGEVTVLPLMVNGNVPGATGINDIVVANKNVNAPMYNVAGQQVNASYKGIVLQNGKKYINK